MIITGSDSLSPSPFNWVACFVLLALLLSLSAQVATAAQVAQAAQGVSSKLPPSHHGDKTGDSSYTVGSGDILSIDVYDNPDLKGEYTIAMNGGIVFPLLGQLNVSGMTLSTIQDKLTTLLEKDYLYNPIVNVRISKYLSKSVKIMGNVGKPGIYYLDSPTRLFDLLTKAAGVSQQFGRVMNGQKAHIMRASGKSVKNKASKKISTYYIDLYQLLFEGKDEANIYLQAGDVIYIPDNKSFHVIGEVKRAGSFPFEQGVTLLKAITLAGGATKKAAPDKTLIKRFKNGKIEVIEANMNTLLLPDDVIDVPLSFW